MHDKGPLVGLSSVTSAAQQFTSKAQLHTSKTKVALVVEKVLLVRCSSTSVLKCVTSTDKKRLVLGP